MLYFLYFISFVFGVVIGSFLNSFIYRTYSKISLVKKRSFCPECKKTLSWHELVPVFSFLFQKGKCTGCGAKINISYPLVEIFSGFFTFLVVYIYVSGCGGFCEDKLVLVFRDLFVVYTLIVLFVYDIKWKIVPDIIILPAIEIVFFINLILSYIYRYEMSFIDMVIGILVGGGFFAFQFFLSRGKWVGGGDIRMGVFMGVVLGWPEIAVSLALAYILGSIISFLMLSYKKINLKHQIPFVPFLAVSVFATMYWEKHIVDYYFSFIKWILGI